MNTSIPDIDTILAIDPGSSGGIAVYNSGSSVRALSMRDTEGDTLYLLRELTPNPTRCMAFIESVGGYVGKAQPASSAFKFGRGFGFLLGVLQERGVRVELVLPRAWQKRLSLGTASACASKSEWKAKLRAEAQRRYPGIKVTLAVADALLILDHGLAALRITSGL